MGCEPPGLPRAATPRTDALPEYRAWLALAKAHRRDYNALERLTRAALMDRRVHVDFGDVLPPDSGETYEFTPPFPVHDTDVSYDDDTTVEDLSFTVPSMGYLVNRIHFAHDYDHLVVTDIYSINWTTRHLSSTSCGINFITPAAGRLRVRATVQNFYNNIVIALRDRFGFSEAYLSVYVRLLIAILRPNHVTAFTTTLLQDGYDAPGGSEVTYQFPSIDSTAPHVFEATTDEVFPANSGMQILAGTQIFIQSDVDDMATYVDALLGWQLQKLTVNIV
jgi:hypothetical protein